MVYAVTLSSVAGMERCRVSWVALMSVLGLHPAEDHLEVYVVGAKGVLETLMWEVQV